MKDKSKQLEKFIESYSPYGRFHISPCSDIIVEDRDEQPKEAFKPIGLWYSIGHDWSKWLLREQPDWIDDFIYEVNILKENVLTLRNRNDLEEFNSEFLTKDNWGYVINWDKVSKIYGGIEVYYYNLYSRNDKQSDWLYGWDVDSGCIWDKSSIESIKKVCEL